MDRETTLDEFAETAEESAEEAGSDGIDEDAVDGEDEGADDGADEVVDEDVGADDTGDEVVDEDDGANEVAADAQVGDGRVETAPAEREDGPQTTESRDDGALEVESGGEDDCYDATPDSPDSEPLDTTSNWTSGEEPCDGCGAHVRRRWRAPDGLVCAECRDW